MGRSVREGVIMYCPDCGSRMARNRFRDQEQTKLTMAGNDISLKWKVWECLECGKEVDEPETKEIPNTTKKSFIRG